MRVLVTGGCGFLGSHVCELFVSKGWDVAAYDNLSKHELIRTGYNVEAARDYNRNLLEDIGVHIQKADILNYDTLLDCTKRTFAEGKCDYIIHTAAQPAMTIALEQPMFDMDVNVRGTLNVLEVARALDIPAAICSTIHVYGNGLNKRLRNHNFEARLTLTPEAISEDEPILTGYLTPLHASKRASEIYARAYREAYGCRVAVFRLTGIYGPRQLGGEDHGWVANFAIRTMLGLPITVFGTDRQVRDILYVRDAAQAFLDWFDSAQFSDAYNIGGGPQCITSIRTCLQMLRELTGKEQHITMQPYRRGDLWYFCCDTTRANKAFGWTAEVLPKEGLSYLVDWIEQNRELFGEVHNTVRR